MGLAMAKQAYRVTQGRVRNSSSERVPGGGGRGWYLGVAESLGHAYKKLQFVNWKLIQTYYTRNTSNATM